MSIEIVPPQPGYEKIRRWPRYIIDVPVRLMAQTSTKVATVLGVGRELSCGGMSVFAGIELPNGEQVAVEFTPPDSEHPVRVRGFVCNRSGYTYGIKFITENDADYSNVGQLEVALKSLGSVP
jgi:PilZ domain